MEIKKRFKLYKSGKNWCMAALMFAGASAGIFMNNVSANADDSAVAKTDADNAKIAPVAVDSQAKEVTLANKDNETADAPVTDAKNATDVTVADDKQSDDSKAKSTVADTPAVKNGAVSENGANYYYEKGQMKTDFFRTDDQGKVFYYGTDGKMYQNKFYQNWGNTYYFGSNGARFTNEWYQNWGNQYRFGDDGALLKGLQLIDGSVYWFDRVNGVMYKDKFYQNWGNTYYFGDDGKRYTNQWYENWGNKYYFGNDGALLKNKFLTENGKVYYFAQDGVMYKNKFYQNWGKTYYFGNDGARYTNKWYENWGNKYYFGNDGALLKNQFLTEDGKVYYFDQDGVMYRNKFYQNWGKTYYFGDNGARYTKQFYTNWGNAYYFGNDGALVKNTQLTVDGDTYRADRDGILTFSITGQKVTSDDVFTGTNAQIKGLLNKLSQTIANKLSHNVTYDWTDETNQYRELAVHEMAQLLSQGDVVNQASVIEKLMYRNNLLTGKVVKSMIINLNASSKNADILADHFIKALGNEANVKNAIVSAGYDKQSGNLDILLFQPGTNEVAKEVATAPTNSKFMSADETPTSQKTADQVELAYKTGGETGLRYESVKVEPIKGMTNDMIRGVDISSYQALLNAGVQFYDFNGQPASLFKVLSDAGVNWVRIRLWNDPYDKNGNGYGGGNNDEASLVKMASEAAQYGLKTLVDFHYSDFWADPAKQILPKAWSQLSDTDLAKEVNLYTKKVLADLKRAGADVQMVSIGNEITKGAFGQVANSSKGEDWKSIWLGDAGKRLTMLLSQASSAVRESGNSKIAIHIEQPNVDKYRQIMTVLKNNGVDYDYLGTSYYPFWLNNSDTLRNVAHMTETEFGKRLVVMEVSWLNDTHDADGTGNSLTNDGGINKFPISPQGQVDVLADMYKALVDTDGIGSFYWEPAWLPVHPGYENWQENKEAGNQYGTGWASKYAVGYAPDKEMYWEGKPTWGGTTWDNQSLFDDHGYPLQSLNMYKGFLYGYETPVNTKVSSTVTAKVGTVTDNPLTGVDVNNQTINLTGLISNAGQFLLQGQPNQVISDTQLQAIANELLTSGKSDLQTTANGDVYHLTYELTDANRTAFVKDNHGKHYGDTLNVSYTTQVVVDRQGAATTNQVTSPITVKVSEVWNAVNNYTPTVDGLLAVGDTLTDQDVDLAQINTKTLQALLTGTKGETVTASYDQIKGLLPGATAALMGTKDYVTADGNHYRYEFWLKDLNQAGLKYGNPLVVSYSASLKWLSKD